MLSLQRHQKINHFPGMSNLARKASMGRLLTLMLRVFPEEYRIFPRTFSIPAELAELRSQFDESGRLVASGGAGSAPTFIVKPDAGTQGRGIFLTRSFADIDARQALVVQEYIARPLLIDGFEVRACWFRSAQTEPSLDLN